MGKDSNEKKSAQLGMPFGTANGRLRKILLFDLAGKLGLTKCYRCSEEILDIEDFTIEHKNAWLDVDPALFWDLDNIAFSHLDCNIGAARRSRATVCHKCKKNPPRYNANGIAKECRGCNTKYKREWRSQVRGRR